MEKEYSGHFYVRAPVSLHRELAERAESEKVSMNQLIVYLVARGLGLDEGLETPRRPGRPHK